MRGPVTYLSLTISPRLLLSSRIPSVFTNPALAPLHSSLEPSANSTLQVPEPMPSLHTRGQQSSVSPTLIRGGSMCIRGGQRGGPCLYRFLLNAFHFGDLERFGNRLATLDTESGAPQAAGNGQNGALGEREGRSQYSRVRICPRGGPRVHV